MPRPTSDPTSYPDTLISGNVLARSTSLQPGTFCTTRSDRRSRKSGGRDRLQGTVNKLSLSFQGLLNKTILGQSRGNPRTPWPLFDPGGLLVLLQQGSRLDRHKGLLTKVTTGHHCLCTPYSVIVSKRGGPWCMRRCLEARLLHPAQCHALC